MKIIIFRHGEKQTSDSQDLFTRRSVLLTKLGLEQIKSLGNKLRAMDLPLDKLKFFSSPYPRAIQSAEIVRNILGVEEFFIEKSLEEFYGYDDYTRSQEERHEVMRQAMIDPDMIVPVEPNSLNKHLDRMEKFFEEQSNQGEELLLCSAHGALIRNWAYRLDPNQKPAAEIIKKSSIKNGGYSVFEYGGTEFFLREFDLI